MNIRKVDEHEDDEVKEGEYTAEAAGARSLFLRGNNATNPTS